MAALVGPPEPGAAQTGQGPDRSSAAPRCGAVAGCLRRSGSGFRSHRGRYPEAARGVADRRPGRGPRYRRAGTRRIGGERRPTRGAAGGSEWADQDGHHRSEGDRRDRQRLQRRDSARRPAVPVRDGSQTHQGPGVAAARRDGVGARRRRRALGRSAGGDAQGEKRSGLRVHARTGLPCPVCGDTVREVSFVDKSFQYCPGCQTGGKVLADRRMSRLLK